jgi:hypothetical protein
VVITNLGSSGSYVFTAPYPDRRTYATAIRSVEREQRLEELLAHGAGVADLIEACLRPPLYATRFHHGFGTLYTAEYRPADGIVRYHWPQRRWEQSLDNIKTDSIQLQLGTP